MFSPQAKHADPPAQIDPDYALACPRQFTSLSGLKGSRSSGMGFRNGIQIGVWNV